MIGTYSPVCRKGKLRLELLDILPVLGSQVTMPDEVVSAPAIGDPSIKADVATECWVVFTDQLRHY